jgi:CheY-like chemotaxis protein
LRNTQSAKLISPLAVPARGKKATNSTDSADTVFIDLAMPDVEGRVLATDIRQGTGIIAATMLILTSAADNLAAGQAWPVDGFLHLPIDGMALARLIGARIW